MRRDRDQAGAVGDREARELDGVAEVDRAVVDLGQQVEVELGASHPLTVTHARAAAVSGLCPPNLATTLSRFAILMPMRDYLAATRDRVVVFDGSMGATLEQFDLSLEHDYKLPGRAHEALVLNRPDVIGDLHESMVEAGAEVVETDTFQASRIKLEEWGLEDHTYEINLKAAEIARAAIGEQRFVAGSIGPTGHLPASDDPTLGQDHASASSSPSSRSRPAAWSTAAPTC